MPAIVEALREVLPADVLVTDTDVIASYAHDEAEWAPFGTPAAVVRPTTSEQVQQVVLACLEHDVAVVPRGAGTGLSGGANALDGCVVISLERMNRIVEINATERLAVVQPGVVNDHLRAAAGEQGLWYPPDPASAPWSTIGGNCATNAGGLCCVKYGVTRDYVLALEVVTGTGELVRVGRRTAKGVVGYDLVGLMVGSEGTLGIITEITVKLRAARAPETTVVGFFPDVVSAGVAVQGVADAGIAPSALELVDQVCLKAVDDWKNMGLLDMCSEHLDGKSEGRGGAAVLLGRIDDPGAVGEQEATRMVDVFISAGASFAARSTSEEEAETFFAARRLAYPALERLGDTLTEDVCVPKAEVPGMLSHIEEIAAKHDTVIANIAHAGDGNLHPLLITEPGDDAARERAQAAFAEIIDAALAVGGTVTGEHGVGLLKMPGLEQEQTGVVIDMQRAIKRALDPKGIFNPGKVFSA